MDNDEFVKLIKKIGQIKPVEEAFKEFPVEEEEHKGKIIAFKIGRVDDEKVEEYKESYLNSN